jgi:hypothetical protein
LYERRVAQEEKAGVQAARKRADSAVMRAHVDAGVSISMSHEALRANTVGLHKALEEAHSLLSPTPDSLFDSAARLTGGASDTLLSPKTGKRLSSAEDLCARTKQALMTTALSLIKTVVKLRAPNKDVSGFASIISEHDHGSR